MAIKKLWGTPTVDAEMCWDVVAEKNGWKIELQKDGARKITEKAVFWREWNPVRLLDDKGTLWASAATVEEMQAALPDLMTEFAAKKPVVTREQVIETGKVLANLLLQIAAKKAGGAAAGKR